MNVRALMTILTLLVRLARQINEMRSRTAGEQQKPATRTSARLSRVAERLLARRKQMAVATQPAPEPPALPPAPIRARRRGGSVLPMLWAAAFTGTTTYLIARQQRRRAARRRTVRAPFPEELLDVLAPPGGEGHFFYTGEGLIDVNTDAFYPVIDGIPDFGGPRLGRPDDWAPDIYDTVIHGVVSPLVWRGNLAGNAALAGAIAAEAFDGWCLSVPCGTGLYEVEMARANPHAKIVCVDASWAMLLEARRKALEAGLANLYFVRGDAELLPLKSARFDGVWSAHGLPQYAHPERAVTQLARTAKTGALVAGVALTPGGPPLPDLALRLLTRRLPGLRDIDITLSLLAAAGLRELRAVRDGALVRFLGTRAP